MGDTTGIEWTDSTWNPVTGCTKVSPGCDHCYAETIAHRFDGTPAFPNGFGVTLRPDRLDQPLRWRRRRRIFVNSMSDLFHESVPDGFIAAVWFIMGQSAGCIPERYRGHTFQILTKRPARMRAWMRKWADVGDTSLPPQHPDAKKCGRAELLVQAEQFIGGIILYDWMDGPRYWPTTLPNVWLGVSVENQKWADIRIPLLLDTPSAVRFISAEPLLGEVMLPLSWLHRAGHTGRVDWVIAGGESGHGARPVHPDWVRTLRDQCVFTGTPFHFKQWGEWKPYPRGSGFFPAHYLQREDGRLVTDEEFWAVTRGHWNGVERLGKKAAGRELDGRTWDEVPSCG